MPISVVTFNLLSDLSLWEERYPLILQQMIALQPDLVALQEVRLPQRNDRRLARDLAMPHVYFSPKTGDAGQREGISILSRRPFEWSATLDLRSQNRVAQCVQVAFGRVHLIFANGHFFLHLGDSPERLQQIELLLDWLPNKQLPTVVCGDFNAAPGTVSIRRMKAEFSSAYETMHGNEPRYTAPTPLPRSLRSVLRTARFFWRQFSFQRVFTHWRGTLDYIFYNHGLTVLEADLALNQSSPYNRWLYPSDHFGLWAVLDFAISDKN